jgi:hypothetical protein
MSTTRSARAHRWLTGSSAALLGPALAFGGPAAVGAQDDDVVLTGRAYPVAIHQGTCADTIVPEPAYDLGFAVPRPVIAAGGGNVAVVRDDNVLTEADFYEAGGDRPVDENTRLLYEDVDGDGTPDYGFDLDEDQVLSVGERLESPIVWSFLGNFDDLTGVIGDDDAGLQDLRDVPHSLVVHGATVDDQDYLACGEVEGISVNEEIVVPLLPVEDTGLTGVAEMQPGDAGFLGLGGNAGAIEVHLWPRLSPLAAQDLVPPTPTPEPTATPTPVPPTPTPEPTPTPVVIEVPTEFTIEFRDDAMNPEEFTILADTDTEITLSNLTTAARVFFIEGLDVREELPPGETLSITVNAPVGEYGYGIEDEEGLRGTLRVRE